MIRQKLILGNLMETFKVSGKKLAEVLNVDGSLVSKWRTGNRMMDASSPFPAQIADYFLSLDETDHFANIRLQLSWSGVDAAAMTRAQLSELLCMQLTGQAGGREEDPAFPVLPDTRLSKMDHFYCFKGIEGRRKAIETLMNLALENPSKHELVLYTLENSEWFGVEQDFVFHWRHMIQSFVLSGGRVSTMRPSFLHDDDLQTSILAWLPMTLTGRVNSYYSSKFISGDVRFTILFLKDVAFLVGFSPLDSDAGHHTTFLFSSEDVVKGCQLILGELLKTKKLLFTPHDAHSGGGIRHLMLNCTRQSQSMYAKMNYPFFSFLPDSELDRLFHKNGVNPSIAQQVKVLNEAIRQSLAPAPGDVEVRFLFDERELLYALASRREGGIALPMFSAAAQKEIYISVDDYKEGFLAFLDHVEDNPKVHIALDAFYQMEDLIDQSLLSVQDSLMLACSQRPDDLNAVFTATLPGVVNSYFRNLDEAWSEIPLAKQDKPTVSRQIKKLLRGV